MQALSVFSLSLPASSRVLLCPSLYPYPLERDGYGQRCQSFCIPLSVCLHRSVYLYLSGPVSFICMVSVNYALPGTLRQQQHPWKHLLLPFLPHPEENQTGFGLHTPGSLQRRDAWRPMKGQQKVRQRCLSSTRSNETQHLPAAWQMDFPIRFTTLSHEM